MMYLLNAFGLPDLEIEMFAKMNNYIIFLRVALLISD